MSRVAVCGTCPRHCRLSDGETGFCRARRAEGGRVVCANYGRITSIALDPIEKKPLAFFHPGRPILSIGSYGCNLRCPFCQNHSISQHGESESVAGLVRCYGSEPMTPSRMAKMAKWARRGKAGNIGVAYTYNEPLVGWEFVRDCAQEVHACGMLNVLVSNGCACKEVVETLAPLIDAANIDLKGPSQEFYDWVGGDFDAVCRTIETLHKAGCHVEVTTLIVPGRNDGDSDMDAIAATVAAISPDIPLHVTRFFPRWQMTDSSPTPIATIRRLLDIASRHLSRVLSGNC